MSLNPEELDDHCRQILGDRRIKSKTIVVLCEGEIRDVEGRRSPQAYAKMEQMPDANFYKRCVPRSWNNKPRPQFFNCGDRKDVIDTYFHIVKLLEEDLIQSLLNKSKLVALVDLDIQSQKISSYCFNNTEEIYHDLYQENKLITEKIDKHRIFTTGLIHKEAYFIAPGVQEAFDCSNLNPQYKIDTEDEKDKIIPVVLEDVYLEIANKITELRFNKDLHRHFNLVVERINYCPHIDCCDLEQFKQTWKKEFQQCADEQRKKELVFILLTIAKVKIVEVVAQEEVEKKKKVKIGYWSKIVPQSNWENKIDNYREQLSLEIAKVYARQDWNNPENHIACLFKHLYELA